MAPVTVSLEHNFKVSPIIIFGHLQPDSSKWLSTCQASPDTSSTSIHIPHDNRHQQGPLNHLLQHRPLDSRIHRAGKPTHRVRRRALAALQPQQRQRAARHGRHELRLQLLLHGPRHHQLGVSAEIFLVEVRALGNAPTMFTNWAINLIFAQFSPQALASIGFRYFYVFFVINVIAMLCYIFFYPKTRG